MAGEITIHPKSGGSRCPLCSEALASQVATHTCSGCRVSYHATCFRELGGCGTLGCSKVPERSPARRSGRRRPLRSNDRALYPLFGAFVALVVGGAIMASAKRNQENFLEEQRRFVIPADGFAPPTAEGPQELDLSFFDAEQASAGFVTSVWTLRNLRNMTKDPRPFLEDSGLGVVYRERLEATRTHYENLLHLGREGETRRSSEEIRRDLRERVFARAAPSDRDALELILSQVWGITVDPSPAPGPR